MKIDRLDIRPDVDKGRYLMCLRDTVGNEYINYEIREELYNKLFEALKIPNEKLINICEHKCDLINFDIANYKCPNCGEVINKIKWLRDELRYQENMEQLRNKESK